jgi:hypothetical protein
MSELHDLSKEELVTMVQALELQLKDLYLEKRLNGLDRDQLIELIGRLEEQQEETVASLSAQLSDLYAAQISLPDSAEDLSSLKKAA